MDISYKTGRSNFIQECWISSSLHSTPTTEIIYLIQHTCTVQYGYQKLLRWTIGTFYVLNRTRFTHLRKQPPFYDSNDVGLSTVHIDAIDVILPSIASHFLFCRCIFNVKGLQNTWNYLPYLWFLELIQLFPERWDDKGQQPSSLNFGI